MFWYFWLRFFFFANTVRCSKTFGRLIHCKLLLSPFFFFYLVWLVSSTLNFSSNELDWLRGNEWIAHTYKNNIQQPQTIENRPRFFFLILLFWGGTLRAVSMLHLKWHEFSISTQGVSGKWVRESVAPIDAFLFVFVVAFRSNVGRERFSWMKVLLSLMEKDMFGLVWFMICSISPRSVGIRIHPLFRSFVSLRSNKFINFVKAKKRRKYKPNIFLTVCVWVQCMCVCVLIILAHFTI